MFIPDPAGTRIGPFWLTPGLSRTHAITMLLVASFLTIGLAAFMNFVQPFLLNEVLHVPREQQGRLTGLLAGLQEVVVILLVGVAGAWSDRVGRRLVFVVGYLLIAAGYAVYPLADSEVELVLFRVLFAAGIAFAPVMLSACVVDSIQEVSRGRWIGINNLFQGLGVVFMATVLAKTPAWLQAAGLDATAAGRYAYWIVAAMAAAGALLLWRGLHPLVPAKRATGTLARELLAAARTIPSNPRLRLAYGAAVIGRGDFAVVGVFFSLWIVQAGTKAGMPAAASLARAGMLFGLIHVAALAWAFFMGMIADRVNRVTSLCIALALAGTGYVLMGQVTDPLGPGLIPVAILLGFGEVSVIVASGALFGQEVVAYTRGSMVGLYNLAGAIGILAATSLGGILFDQVAHTAPFTVMGIVNLLLLALALHTRVRAGQPGPRPVPALVRVGDS